MFVTLTYRADGSLSFIGTGRHGAGQVFEFLTKDTPAPDYTRKDCFRLQQAWRRWHLNHMRPGTPKQEEAVRKWRQTAEDIGYKATCEMLKSIDLLVDNGYRYGTAWLKEKVPVDVLEWLFSLPGLGNTFDDIHPLEIDEQVFNAILEGYV